MPCWSASSRKQVVGRTVDQILGQCHRFRHHLGAAQNGLGDPVSGKRRHHRDPSRRQLALTLGTAQIVGVRVAAQQGSLDHRTQLTHRRGRHRDHQRLHTGHGAHRGPRGPAQRLGIDLYCRPQPGEHDGGRGDVGSARQAHHLVSRAAYPEHRHQLLQGSAQRPGKVNGRQLRPVLSSSDGDDEGVGGDADGSLVGEGQ
jgi:hypothetical protein